MAAEQGCPQRSRGVPSTPWRVGRAWQLCRLIPDGCRGPCPDLSAHPVSPVPRPSAEPPGGVLPLRGGAEAVAVPPGEADPALRREPGPAPAAPGECPTAVSHCRLPAGTLGWIPSGARLWGFSWGKKGAKRAHQGGLRATGRGDVLEGGAATHRCHQQHNLCGVRALGLAQRGSHAFGFLCNRPEIAKPLEEEAEAQKTGSDSRDCLPQSLRVF